MTKQSFDLVLDVARLDGLVGGQKNGYLLESDDKPHHYIAVGIGLTAEGHKALERLEKEAFLVSNVRHLRNNVLTILISVITAVAVSWAVFLFGAPN